MVSDRAWEVIEEPASAAAQLLEAMRRRRASLVLPWAHPALLPDFQPLFDWERKPTGQYPLGKRILFSVLQRAPRFAPDSPIPGDAVRSVLLFRYDAVGDYLVTTPLVEWLRRSLPQARLTVLTSTRNDALVGQDPRVDAHVPIHPMHGVHPSWLVAMGKARGDYDVVFALVFTHMSKAAILARALAPAAEYIAPRHWERAGLYGRVFHRQPEHLPWREHWAQTLLRMGQETIAAGDKTEGVLRLTVPLSAEACLRTWEWLQREGLGFEPPPVPILWARGSEPLPLRVLPGNPYGVLNLSAYSRNRRWMLHHAFAVCRELLGCCPEMEFVVAAAPQQWRQAEALVGLLGHRRFRCFRGSLSELIALIAGARWVLSPDTAVVHVAAALGKPVVGLYAELIKVCEWYPFGVPFVLALSPALEGVSFVPVGAVVEAVERLVQEVMPSGFAVPLPTAGVPGAGAKGVR